MIDCKRLSKYSIDELVVHSFDCDCGKTHNLAVEKIFCSFGATAHLPQCIEEKLPIGRLLVVTADDIFDSIALPLIESIKCDDRQIDVFRFEKNVEPSLKNASLLFENDCDTRLVLAIGSNSIVEMSKYFASVRKIPIIAVATALSSSNYLTATSEVVVDKRRKFLPSTSVSVLFFDLDIMSFAPSQLLAGGVGNVLSNYLSVFDWNIAYKFTDEPFCDKIADLLVDAAELMMKGVIELRVNSNLAFTKIAQALLYSCIAHALTPSETSLSGGQYYSSNVLMLLQSDEHFKHNHGEYLFKMFTKLVLVYKLFFETNLRDNSLPPDVDERYSLLVSVLNFRPAVANAMTSATISPKTYEYIKLKLAQTRDFFKTGICDIALKRDFMIELFKSIYENDEGEWLDSVPLQDVKMAIALSTEIEPHFDALTIMKHFGLLEGFLYTT